MDDLDPLARRYLVFADAEARGSSASYERWSRAVAADPDLLSQLATLPVAKQQPNLVFAALRWHGERPGDTESLRHGLLDGWEDVSRTIRRRSTQTNEPARCAVLLPLLHRIGRPLALIELGAAAGLCLIPDRYGYAYSDGTVNSPGDLVVRCQVAAGRLPADLSPPPVVWRAGVDLNPLDPADPDTAAWLTTLIWPEHDHRRRRLAAALRLAAAEDVRIDRGDLRGDLGGRLRELVAEVPAGATPVVFHSAALAYLADDDRAAATVAITGSGARWISFEGRDVIALARDLPEPVTLDTAFVAALDREPVALASAHGDTLTMLGAA